MSVDWNKPIICKENGARLEVVAGPDWTGCRPCRPVASAEWPDGDRRTLWASESGWVPVANFTVINAPEATDEIPHWAKVRAYNLAYGDQEWFDTLSTWMISRTARAFARYIAQHEPEPVDPDLELAREAAATASEEKGWPDVAAETRRGERDDTISVESALRAIKLVRERGE